MVLSAFLFWIDLAFMVMFRSVFFSKQHSSTYGALLPPTVTNLSLVDRLPLLKNDAKRIVLIRHGETDWNKEKKIQGGGFDIELNNRGKEQARLLARELSSMKFGLIASSHLKRSCQTAEILFQAVKENDEDGSLNCQRIQLTGFGEMQFGDFEGLSWRGPQSTPEVTESFQAINNQMKEDKTVSWPGKGESIGQVEERARKAFYEQVLGAYPDVTTIGIVAHGRLNVVLLASILKGDGQYFSDYQQTNCCINIVDQMKDGSFEPVVINHNDHIT